MRHLRDLREGFRILCSGEFWRGFRDYWSGGQVSARIDEYVHVLREQTGQKPDPEVERRRAQRRARDADA